MSSKRSKPEHEAEKTRQRRKAPQKTGSKGTTKTRKAEDQFQQMDGAESTYFRKA